MNNIFKKKIVLLLSMMCNAFCVMGFYRKAAYVDCIETPQGWVVTEYDKYPHGYTAEIEKWDGVKLAVLVTSLAGLIGGCAWHNKSPGYGSVLLWTLSGATVIGKELVDAAYGDSTSDHDPDYKPSTFEQDQKKGGYEYYVRSVKTFKTEQKLCRKYQRVNYTYLPSPHNIE